MTVGGATGSFSIRVVLFGLRFRLLLELESIESSFDALLLLRIGDGDFTSALVFGERALTFVGGTSQFVAGTFTFDDGTLLTAAADGSSVFWIIAVGGLLRLRLGL